MRQCELGQHSGEVAHCSPLPSRSELVNSAPVIHPSTSFVQWIHEDDLFRRLADSTVAMAFIAPQNDIRPSWPLRQLAALIPRAVFEEVPAVDHNLWANDPQIWVDVITRACRAHIDDPG
jgi:pimeloyl-ACP methyl ester carboxylesterase